MYVYLSDSDFLFLSSFLPLSPALSPFAFYLLFRYYARKVLHLAKRNMCVTVVDMYTHAFSCVAVAQLKNVYKFTLKGPCNQKLYKFFSDSGRNICHSISARSGEKKVETKTFFLQKKIYFNVYSTHMDKLVHFSVCFAASNSQMLNRLSIIWECQKCHFSNDKIWIYLKRIDISTQFDQ